MKWFLLLLAMAVPALGAGALPAEKPVVCTCCVGTCHCPPHGSMEGTTLGMCTVSAPPEGVAAGEAISIPPQSNISLLAVSDCHDGLGAMRARRARVWVPSPPGHLAFLATIVLRS